jgi:methylenetetrahydrofolate dehydrogenase (NADP+)/methenyltetrahydrofolate cyclohydrolase
MSGQTEGEFAMASLIDGKQMAARLIERAAAEARDLVAHRGFRPALAVVLVGDDPASRIYVKRKLAACAKVGVTSHEFRLADNVSADELLGLIDRLNADPAIHGILVQLPLPPHIDGNTVLDRIDPAKDVDGFHPVNVGRLSTGGGGLVPCTPLGCMMLLESVIAEPRGLHAVVIGKSNIVGKPVALLLLERECTVTVTHIATRDLPSIVRKADIVVVAAGHAGLVRGDWVKAGAVVIDVGINRVTGPDGASRIVGDACADEMPHALAVTPVPGGVGPMTVACLMANTVAAASATASVETIHEHA